MAEYVSYAPLMSTIIDSSIWEEPLHVRVLWITLLAKKGPDHCVTGHAYMMKRWANLTEEEVLDALQILSSPDTKRKQAQEFDGRRIENVGGDTWKILNGPKYQAEMRAIAERARKARWAADKRAEKRKQTRENASLEVSTADMNRWVENGVKPEAMDIPNF